MSVGICSQGQPVYGFLFMKANKYEGLKSLQDFREYAKVAKNPFPHISSKLERNGNLHMNVTVPESCNAKFERACKKAGLNFEKLV